MDQAEYMRRQMLISKAFRPASPVDDVDLFAGRTEQMVKVLDAVEQPGQHVVVYGGRGVGKTSLAKFMAKTMRGPTGYTTVHYTCSTTATFDSIWREVLGDLELTSTVAALGFSGPDHQTVHTAAELLLDEATTRPDRVRRAMTVLSQGRPVAIFIDEFERPTDAETKALFADTIKILSDQLVPATLILVGVADNVDELLQEHASIRRSLVEIYMPNMSDEELAEIVVKGLTACEMTFEPAFAAAVVTLARGLPNYVHLITQNAARVAVDDERVHVLLSDVEPAITRSVESIQQAVLDTYHRATSSNRETLYKEVLLACALARRDEKGTFGAADVREELSRITGKYRDLPAFAQHLNDFSGSDHRGGVLEKLGGAYRSRYRFTDPLLQPYVLMRARIDNLMPPYVESASGEDQLPLDDAPA